MAGRRLIVAFACTLSVCVPAMAQTRVFPAVGAEYGRPLKFAGRLELLVVRDCCESATSMFNDASGPVFELTAGQGGFKLAAGWSKGGMYVLWPARVGLDLKGTVVHTWGEPAGTVRNVTHAGLEAGLTLYVPRVTIGVLRRVAGDRSAADYLFTWSVGVRFGFLDRTASR